MPTFNQLVRNGRQQATYKSTAPALQKGVNTLKNRTTDLSSPQKRGVCTMKKLGKLCQIHVGAACAALLR